MKGGGMNGVKGGKLPQPLLPPPLNNPLPLPTLNLILNLNLNLERKEMDSRKGRISILMKRRW